MIALLLAVLADDVAKLKDCARLMAEAERQLEAPALREAEASQAETVRRLEELLRQARAAAARSSRGSEPKPDPAPRTSPAPQPYRPERAPEPSEAFRTRTASGPWGRLPERLREAIRQGSRDIDQYPPEFRERIRDYTLRLIQGEK